MKITNLFFAALLLLMVFSCKRASYEKNTDGIVVKFRSTGANSLRTLRIQVISDRILHVDASCTDSLPESIDYMVEKKARPAVHWDLQDNGKSLLLKTSLLKANVSLETGAVTFLDSDSNVLLSEVKNGGKTFVPMQADGEQAYSVRQIFNSPDDEAFYGLGQLQHGWLNLKGKDVDLTQLNSYACVPFLVSGRHYGLLWDNYSITRFGDPRDFQPLSDLKLFSRDGVEGGLTATYAKLNDPSRVAVQHLESDINYEFLGDMKKFPKEFSPADGKVTWEGYIESSQSGLEKFLLFSAGYTKFWLDGKLVADKWRQAWNPNKDRIYFPMEKGKRYPVKIEWIPDGGESYMSLKCLNPVSPEEQNRLSLWSEMGDKINYYFVYGANTDEVISGYRDITGKAPIMPKWAMGFWQSRERYKTQDELLGVVKEYRKRNIPLDNIVLDWQYWRPDQWGSQDFDSTRFPDPSAMINELHQMNSRLMISVWAKFYEGIRNYNLMNDKGYLYTTNVKNHQKDWIGYVSTFYDAFNPNARDMFWDLINQHLYHLGIDAWWMDATEPDILSNSSIAERKELMKPTWVKSPTKYFNTFSVANAKGIYEGQRKVNPGNRVFILTRSAYAGLQRYAAATWSGDIGTTWHDMMLQIPAGLNFSLAGIPYWTMDIGGFAVERRYEHPDEANLQEWRELNTRWFQFGAFCPIFRVHGQFPYREIYNISPENSVYYKSQVFYDKLRYRLMPYIYSLAGETYFNDYTMMRAMFMDFPNDKNTASLNDQYMFGPSLLVAPVYKYKAVKRGVYLPEGQGWYDLYTGKYLKGGETISADAPLSTIPVFVKEGSIVPFGPDIQYSTQKSDPVTLYVYTGKDAHFDLYEDENTNYDYEKGLYSVISVDYHESTKTLTIGDRKGSFPGMLAKRTFNIVTISAGQAKNLDFNRKPEKVVTYQGESISIEL